MKETPMAVERAELKDVYSRLQQLGYYEAVFDFNFITQEGHEPHVDPSRVRVIVTCTENNFHQAYDAADRNTWIEEFADDLRSGHFGPPPRGVPTEGRTAAATR
jgi:hypothetical protein